MCVCVGGAEEEKDRERMGIMVYNIALSIS